MTELKAIEIPWGPQLRSLRLTCGLEVIREARTPMGHYALLRRPAGAGPDGGMWFFERPERGYVGPFIDEATAAMVAQAHFDFTLKECLDVAA